VNLYRLDVVPQFTKAFYSRGQSERPYFRVRQRLDWRQRYASLKPPKDFVLLAHVFTERYYERDRNRDSDKDHEPDNAHEHERDTEHDLYCDNEHDNEHDLPHDQDRVHDNDR